MFQESDDDDDDEEEEEEKPVETVFSMGKVKSAVPPIDATVSVKSGGGAAGGAAVSADAGLSRKQR